MTGRQTNGNSYSKEDIEKNKTIAGLSYLLFFLPLLACPESKYARFHANQALLLLLVSIAGSIVLSLIPFIGWILRTIFGIGVLVLCIFGLSNGLSGKATRLPFIGSYDILR